MHKYKRDLGRVVYRTTAPLPLLSQLFFGEWAGDDQPALLPVYNGVLGRLCPLTPLQETVKDSPGWE